MPLFSLRNQLWGGMNLEPGDLMPGPVRDHRVLCESKYAMHAPEGHHIARLPGAKKWAIVPDNTSEKSKSSKSDDTTLVSGPPETEAADAPKTKTKDKGTGKGRIKRLLGGSRDE